MSSQSRPFVFDEWMKLAQSDPRAFEQRRRQAIEETIGSAPADTQQRLRGLQWRIDMERRRSGNPTAAFLRVYKMMMESVYSEGGLSDSLNDLLAGRLVRNETDGSEKAAVLPFDRARS